MYLLGLFVKPPVAELFNISGMRLHLMSLSQGAHYRMTNLVFTL